MRHTPGFLPVLQSQLESLPQDVLNRINPIGGLEVSDIFKLLTNPIDHTVDDPYVVSDDEVVKNEDISVDAFWLGKNSLVNGETAHCILVDDVSFTRRSESHPSLLELQLMKVSWVKEIWLFVDPCLLEKTRQVVKNVGSRAVIFQQLESVSLTPSNELLIIEGHPVLYGCGTGDLTSVLVNSESYREFISSGGKYVNVCTANNYLGGAHPVIIGQHILGNKPLTCEVTAKQTTDAAAILCEHAGFSQLVEKFRFSHTTDLEEFKLVSTENMVFGTDLDFSVVNWKWHRTKKLNSGRLDVRHVRFISDLTSTFQTQFIKTPRHYCYLPPKD